MPFKPIAFIRRVDSWILPAVLLAGLAAGSGCGSLKSSRQAALQKELDENPKYSIAGISGPQERALNQAKWERKRADLSRGADPETQAALEAYDNALALYDAENFAAAEKEFKKLGKERRARYESFATRFRRTWGLEDKTSGELYGTYGDAIEEDAIFMLAESQFAQKKYADAQTTYEDLLTRYPSTRYLDPTTRRLFRIARYWLDFPDTEDENGEIKVAATETASQEVLANGRKPSSLSRVPVLPNLTDKSRPLFDTYGRGEQALRSIWLHDSTGPLAPDALMLAANHNLRTDDYVEARRLYALLREQYPDSRHLKDAYLLGSHVTLASYQGAAYDGETLENAKQLKQELLALFPGLTEEERERLLEEISILKDAEIAREWDLVEFYRVKRNNAGVKLHCYRIINKYPDTKYAELASEMILKVQEEEKAWANSPFNLRKKKQPQAAAPRPTQSAQPQPKQPENAQPQEPSSKGRVVLPDPDASDSQKPAESTPKPGFLERMNPLRRAVEPPKLESPPDENRPLMRDDLVGHEKEAPVKPKK